MSALATAYVEDCLCGALGAYIVAARWLDGPQGRELMREEGARTLLYNQVVQRMPGGASLEALRQQKLARLQAAAGAGAANSSSPPGHSLPHVTPAQPPGRTVAAAARAALQPWMASLAAPVAQAKAQAGVLLTAMHGAFFNPSLSSSHRSASAPAGQPSAPAVAGTSRSLSDQGGSSNQVGQHTQRTEDSSSAEVHAGCGTSSGCGGVTASAGAGAGAGGGGVDYASAAKVVAVAVAATVLLYALKAEQKNIRAAAKRALGRGRALVGEFAGLALTFSPNPIAAAGLVSRR